MPTISFFQKDFEELLGRTVPPEQLESWLPLVKGELKDVTQATGEIRVELQDSNRPDLWSVEGIARQRPARRHLVPAGVQRPLGQQGL